MIKLRSHIAYAVTDADLKLNEKIAIVCGHLLCRATKGNTRLYRTFRHSLRSGRWNVIKAYKMVR